MNKFQTARMEEIEYHNKFYQEVGLLNDLYSDWNIITTSFKPQELTVFKGGRNILLKSN